MDSFFIERKKKIIYLLFSKQWADTSGSLKSGTDKGMLVEVDLARCDLQPL